MEKSLSKQHKLYLMLYCSQQPTVDVENVELRLWQEQLLDIIDEGGSDRKTRGFNPTYKVSPGAHRVARFDITNKPSDLLHILSQCALGTTDIFLFNHQRCLSSEDCCYSLLEMIKDGYASAPKFHDQTYESKLRMWLLYFLTEIQEYVLSRRIDGGSFS